MTRPSWHWWLV